MIDFSPPERRRAMHLEYLRDLRKIDDWQGEEEKFVLQSDFPIDTTQKLFSRLHRESEEQQQLWLFA